jgi:hypothetical protein
MPARSRVASLFVLIRTCRALALPSVDLPGTAFDATNTSINETVVPNTRFTHHPRSIAATRAAILISLESHGKFRSPRL